jgi:hypothetical protein
MVKLFSEHRGFIARQKIFFVASARALGHANLSPKGMELCPHAVLQELTEKTENDPCFSSLRSLRFLL